MFLRFHEACSHSGIYNQRVCRRHQREAEEAVTYVLRTVRSWVQLRASPADRPQSEQIWCSQVMGGRPCGLRQFQKRELRLGDHMPCAELPWPVHYLAYVQRGRTVRGGAGEQSTGCWHNVIPESELRFPPLRHMLPL